MTDDSNNYSFANYNSLVENTEASGNAVTDALVRTIRVVHQLANSAAKQETHVKNSGEILHNILNRLGTLEDDRTNIANSISGLEKILPDVQYKDGTGQDGTGQQQQEHFAENILNRLGQLELWRSRHTAGFDGLVDSFTSLKHSVGVHAGRFERSDRHIQEWAGTLKDKERHAVENFEALRSKIEKLEGRDDPSSTFGDNVLASLQELKEGGQICEMFAGDMAETARDVIGDTDFADHVESALNNMDLAEHITVDSLDQYDLWDHIRGYVEDYVEESTISGEDKDELDRVDNAQGATIDLILERLKLIGFALDPRDRELHGDNRTDKDKFHDGMRPYSDFLDDANRRLLAEFANELLDAQNKQEDVVNALNGEEKTGEDSQDS